MQLEKIRTLSTILLTLLTVAALAQCVDGDCINGRGAFINKNGNLLSGNFQNGRLQGQGVCHFKWGAKYVGHFQDGEMHGKGTYIHADGSVEVGTWENDIQSETASTQQVQANKARIIIVGINDYGTEKLAFAEADAKAIQQFFTTPSAETDNHRYGSVAQFLEADVQLLTASQGNATLASVQQAIQTTLQNISSNETLLFFFFGKYAGSDLLLTDGSLNINDLQQQFKGSKAQQAVSFIDASLFGDANDLMAMKNDAGNAAIPTNNIILKKVSEVSIEYDGFRNGVFAHYFLQGLRGASDTDLDGNIALDEIFNYISRKADEYSDGMLRPTFAASPNVSFEPFHCD